MDAPRWQAALRSDLIALRLQTEQYERAVEPLQTAIEEAATKRRFGEQLTFMTELANVHYELEQFNQAIDIYQRDLSLAEDMEDQLSVVRLLQRLGAACADKGELSVSLEYGQLALNRAQQIGEPKLLAEQRVMVGLTLLELDRKGEARELLAKAIQDFETVGDYSLAKQTAKMRN